MVTITPDIQYSRTVIDIATYLSRMPNPDQVLDGIRLYLQGNIPEVLYSMNWKSSKTKPEHGSWVIFDEMYWYPTSTYNVRPFVRSIPIQKKCDKCGENFLAYEVTILCSTANPNQWKTRLECPNIDCLKEEYYKEAREDIVKKYGEVV